MVAPDSGKLDVLLSDRPAGLTLSAQVYADYYINDTWHVNTSVRYIDKTQIPHLI